MNASVVKAIVWMRLQRVAADRSHLIWLFVMPLVFGFFMGTLMGDWSPGPGERPALLVSDADRSNVSTAIVDAMADDPAFVIARADTVVALAQARALVEHGTHPAVLLIAPGLADSLAAGLVPHPVLLHDSERNSAQQVRKSLAKAVAAAASRAAARSLVAADPAHPADDEAVRFDEAHFDTLIAHPRIRLEATSLGRSREENLALTDARQHSGPAYTLMFTLMFLVMSAKDLVDERRLRTLDRLRVSHATVGELTAGFFLGNFVVGAGQFGLLLLLNNLLFGIDYGDSPATLVALGVLFPAFCAGIALLIGCLARTPGQADGLGMAVGMSLPALGGLWWPLEIVPGFMQTLGRLLPSGQAITVFHDLIGRGYGLAETAPQLIGLAVWATVTLLASIWAFRRFATPA